MRKELAHVRLLTGKAAEHSLANGRAVEEGRKLVEAAACRRCHTIEGRGNRLATNLDNVAWGREQAELMASITSPVENMPVFNFDAGQTEALVAYLLNGRRPTASEQAYRVQFVRGAVRVQSVFDEKCGGCHRLLTRLGPSGVGTRGPNLSGLFTDFYPQTAPGDRRWSPAVLSDWLANPRSVRLGTLMPPIPLSEAELRQVVEVLDPSPLPR